MSAELQRLQDVGLLFRAVNFNFREQVDQALRAGGVALSFGQISALGILAQHPGLNGAELARHGMVSAQAMTGVLRALAAGRYLQRREHPDSPRADAWHVASRGERLLARARRIFGAVMSRMLAPLDAREQRELERYLRLCNASLVEDVAPAVNAARRATRAAGRSRPGRVRPTRRGR